MGPSRYINITTMEVNGRINVAEVWVGWVRLYFIIHIANNSRVLYCVQSARGITVNESCPCRAHILLKERENEKAKVAND